MATFIEWVKIDYQSKYGNGHFKRQERGNSKGAKEREQKEKVKRCKPL